MSEFTPYTYLPVDDFDPFAGPALKRFLPTTPPQIEIWTACQLGGSEASRAFNESLTLTLDGPLNQSAFVKAWADLVQRHEALRTTFSPNGQLMCVSDELTVPLTIHDLRQAETTAQAEAIASLTRQEAHHLFELETGPLVRASLIQQSATGWQFILCAHHIICDGWSMGVLLQELGQLYSGYVQIGWPPRLPQAAQLSDYAALQQTVESTARHTQCEAYWLAQFSGNVPALDVPTDTPRSVPRTYASRRADFLLEDTLVEALKRVGRQVGSSFVATLTAAFEVWLHQLTRQRDIVLGLPTAGQLAVDQYDLVGHCVHLLPLRSQYVPEESFGTYLQKRRPELMDALEHQQLTFGSLLQKLPIRRDPARIPLVPVVFNVDTTPDKGIAFAHLSHRLVSNPRAFENFELSVNALGTPNGLTLLWSYNAQLFQPQTITGFNRSFGQLLEAIIRQPDLPLAAISAGLRGQADAGQAVAAGNTLAYPKTKALSTLLSETAARFPQKTALRFGNESLTYAAMDAQANQVAHALLARGIRPGDRVGLAVERSLPLIVAILGILKTGAAYVPVDPQHPADRLTFILNDAGCSLLLTSQAYAGRLPLADGREEVIESLWPTLDTYPPTPPEQGPLGHDIAYILYTSGTTGRPKGALIRHHSVANVLYSIAAEPGLTAADKTVALATIAFDLAVVEIYTPLLVGAELLLIDSATARNAEALAHVLADPTITFVQTTPATFRLLLAAGWRGHKALRVISCAEALPMDLAQTLLGCCAELWNYYGPTETTIYATGKRIWPTDQQITIGYPIANTRLYLLDETGQLAAEGQPGEICIAGDGVSGTYLNQPELTAQKFVDNPFVTLPEKLYRTGDLGRFVPSEAHAAHPDVPDLVYLGRIDQQVKIRGLRIELGEIEQVIRQIPGVAQVLVMAREDQPGNQRLVAYLVLTNAPQEPWGANGFVLATAEQARTWRKEAARSLPDYMVPTDYVLLPLLPVTTNGKLDRKALPDPGLAVLPPPSVLIPPDATQRAETPEEQVVLSLWQDALKQRNIGLDDNFFELGGHSLIAVQVMARLADLTGRRLPLASLFTYPTVRSLASLFQTDSPDVSWRSLVPIKPTGTRKPLYIVHGAGLNVLLFNAVAQNLHPDQPIYGLQARGLNGIDEPFQTIEAMAAHYVADIVAHDPEGPYSLSGFSFGGVVAYEMARQMLEQGRKVALVALFDAEAFDSVHEKTWWIRSFEQARLSLRKVGHTVSLLQSYGWQGVRYKMESIDRKLIKKYWRLKTSNRPDHALLRRAIRAYWQLKFGQEQQQEAILDVKFKIEAINDLALARFQLKPADLEVHVFRAMTQTFYIADPVHYGWTTFARKGVQMHDIPGEHSYIFAPPNDKEFSRKLQTVLDQRDGIQPVFRPPESYFAPATATAVYEVA